MTQRDLSCPSCSSAVKLEERASCKAGNLIYICKSCGGRYSLLESNPQLRPKADFPDSGDETVRLKVQTGKSSKNPQLSELVAPSGKEPLPSGVSLVLDLVEGEERGKSFQVEWTRTVLGRDLAEIQLMDQGISRRHAMIQVSDPETILLKDLASTNGTYHNGRLIDHCKIEDGDEIQIGSSVLAVLLN
jgi:pSer/pThr/pTyr-binding forkhead associated (FHA) protein